MRPLVAVLVVVAFPVAAEALATRRVEPRQVARALPVEANVEAVRQAVVAAQVSGRVVDLRVDAGQAVRRGELLLRLDAREAAESAVAAKARLADAQAAYERARSLQRQNFVSPAAVDRARAEFEAAKAGSAATLAAASHAAIHAPIAGVVAVRHVENGEMATPGKPLLTLFDPQALRALAAVPQARIGELRAAKLAIVEFPESGRRLESREITILPTADRETHVVQVRVGLPVGAAIPGSAVRIHFVTGEVRVLSVPGSAIVRRGEVAAVYVRAADARLSLRQLRLGEVLADGETEILAGVQAGEEVALDPVKAAIALKAALPARSGRGD